MSRALSQRKKQEGNQEVLLRLLEHVGNDGTVSQARFADQVGIAKGLANAYFNRCLEKGWIKLQQIPRRRYLYYLTPVGFAEKTRLTALFLSHSYQFYREARADLSATMAAAARDQHRRLGVLGCGELAEIAAIVSEECEVDIVGFVGKEGERDTLAGRPVVSTWRELGGSEAALLATVDNANGVYDDFRRAQPGVPTYVPKQLAGLIDG